MSFIAAYFSAMALTMGITVAFLIFAGLVKGIMYLADNGNPWIVPLVFLLLASLFLTPVFYR